MKLKPHEILYLFSMGKRFAVTAIYATTEDANRHMEKEPDDAVIACVGDEKRGELIFIAKKYSGVILRDPLLTA